MTTKGRLNRPKLPVGNVSSTQNGLANHEPPESGASETTSLLGGGEMVETTSPPRILSLRPEAPEFDLSPAPDRAEDFERSDEPPRVGRDDDASVPPVDLDAGFFSGGAESNEASFEVDARDPLAALKRTPAAARRRAHLAKYVTAAVGLASALCIAALVKSSFAGGHESTRPQRASFEAQAAATAAALNGAAATESVPSPALPANSAPADAPAKAGSAPAVAEATPPVASAVVQAPVAAATQELGAPGAATAPPVAGTPAHSVEASRAAAIPAREVAAAAEPPADPKVTAGKEKAKSRAALERGNMPAAIAAGERSVALDSTDAEAWLILGAAYQQKGDAKNAARSFRACVSQGKRGPTSDCAAMLR